MIVQKTPLDKAFCCIIDHCKPPCKGKFSESITSRLAGFVMTHDLSANRLKAQQRLVERLAIIEVGGYEEFRRVLEEDKQ